MPKTKMTVIIDNGEEVTTWDFPDAGDVTFDTIHEQESQGLSWSRYVVPSLNPPICVFKLRPNTLGPHYATMHKKPSPRSARLKELRKKLAAVQKEIDEMEAS